MEVNNADINSVCFGILCNFTPICGEDRAKEAVAIVRSLQAENQKLYELIEEFQKLLHAYQDVVVPDQKNRLTSSRKSGMQRLRLWRKSGRPGRRPGQHTLWTKSCKDGMLRSPRRR